MIVQRMSQIEVINEMTLDFFSVRVGVNRGRGSTRSAESRGEAGTGTEVRSIGSID